MQCNSSRFDNESDRMKETVREVLKTSFNKNTAEVREC